MGFIHADSFENIKKEGIIFIFKHSNICPVSSRAKEEVEKFPQDVYLIVVQEQRDLSNDIADKLEITHESPQLIILKDGDIVQVLNHGSITAESISEII